MKTYNKLAIVADSDLANEIHASIPVSITALYKFTHVCEERVNVLYKEIIEFCEINKILGLILISTEGINGTIAGSKNSIDAFKKFSTSVPEYGEIIFKDSESEFTPFKRLKVEIRDEIVTLGRKDIVPINTSNHHLSPKEWHDVLVNEKDYVLIDTRNFYEYEIGRFKGAVDPKTDLFSEFPEFVKSQDYKPDQKILMYCTGGIRCEKALVYMQQEGFKNVYQLEGGILNYLSEYPNGEWEGECFIFDHRVALDKHLKASKQYSLCPHCGNPGKEVIKCLRCSESTVICSRCQTKKELNTCSKNCSHHITRGSRIIPRPKKKTKTETVTVRTLKPKKIISALTDSILD